MKEMSSTDKNNNGIVITGPTGAIGMALIKQCIAEGRKVLAICHHGSKRINQIPNDLLVRVVEADLAEYANLDITDICTGEYEVFMHLAWNGTVGDSRNNMALQADNIQYALDAVELAERLGCKTFIGAGSQAEYGRVNEPLRPDTPTFPENGYGIAKLAAGQMTRIRCEQLGLKHIWTRILSVYGPYDGENSMIMSALRKMLNNEETHFTAGDQIWDYLYSVDAAEMLLYLAQKGESKKIYLLGDGAASQLKEFIMKMYKQTGCKARLGIGDIPYNANAVMYLCVAKEHLINFGKARKNFENGIDETIRYIKSKE